MYHHWVSGYRLLEAGGESEDSREKEEQGNLLKVIISSDDQSKMAKATCLILINWK